MVLHFLLRGQARPFRTLLYPTWLQCLILLLVQSLLSLILRGLISFMTIWSYRDRWLLIHWMLRRFLLRIAVRCWSFGCSLCDFSRHCFVEALRICCCCNEIQRHCCCCSVIQRRCCFHYSYWLLKLPFLNPPFLNQPHLKQLLLRHLDLYNFSFCCRDLRLWLLIV